LSERMLSIGSAGFGFERDIDRTPIRLPHLGGVANRAERGDRSVHSGSAPVLSSLRSVEDDVKVDNLVHIAHNCVVGKGTLISRMRGAWSGSGESWPVWLDRVQMRPS